MDALQLLGACWAAVSQGRLPPTDIMKLLISKVCKCSCLMCQSAHQLSGVRLLLKSTDRSQLTAALILIPRAFCVTMIIVRRWLDMAY